MSIPGPPPGPSPILETHGPALAGVFVNIMLYGVQLLQTFIYFDSYKEDSIWMKSFVGLLLLGDTLNTMFAAGWIFKLMIIDFANIQAYLTSNWLLATDPAMGGIIACACQIFFAWRILVLTRNYIITAVVCLLATLVMTGGLALAIGVSIHPDLTKLDRFKPWLFVWLLPALIADIVITVTLTYFLRSRSKGFKKTETVLRRLVRLTIQNCLLTTLVTAGDVLSFLLTSKGYHLGFSFPIPKLYSNSVLTSLNSRQGLKNKMNWEAQQTSNTSGADWEGRSGINFDRSPAGTRHTASRNEFETYNMSSRLAPGAPGPKIYVDVQTVSDTTNHDGYKPTRESLAV